MPRTPRAHLNHIGVAVKDLPAVTRLLQIIGLSSDSTEDVPEQGVRTHFFPLPKEQTYVELLEPTDPQGTVAQFIAKRGPGIHHLSFEVARGELDPLCERLRQEGFKLIYEQPRMGAHNMKVNFIHPAGAGGMLIEVMEKAD